MSTAHVRVPIGPQHPLLKEPLCLVLDTEGERVADVSLRIGYVHRGIERLCQERTYVQAVRVIERVCGICSHVHTTAFCHSVERLMGIEAPPRAVYLRVLLCELERMHSHLLWLGVLAEAIGFTTVFMYAWRDREILLDLMEGLSGGRVCHAVNQIGGVRIDVGPEQLAAVGQGLADFQEQLDPFRSVLARDHSFRMRTEGLGVLTLAQVRSLGVVGPTARAAGSTLDLRRDAGYAAYPQLTFQVITGSGGDVWSRAQVRLLEVYESVSLCEQVLAQLPAGPVSVRAPRKAPPGEIVTRIEAPRGELLYYVRSDGSNRPARVKVRTPTMPSLRALQEQLPGLETADTAAVIAGADLCIACADR